MRKDAAEKTSVLKLETAKSNEITGGGASGRNTTMGGPKPVQQTPPKGKNLVKLSRPN